MVDRGWHDDGDYHDAAVTIVALLATPEAARPSVPAAIPDIVPLRRTP
jgi:hypothetical protein